MKKIEWKDEYNLGIPAIDRQHRKLFDYLNELREGILACNTEEAIQQSVKDLYNYGKEHFAFEEKLMELGQFNILAEHKDKHHFFNQEIEKYNRKIVAGENMMATDLMVFIKKWLLEHILIEDRKYADFFQQHRFTCSLME